MGWHIIKRLLQAVPVLLGIATITFFIIHLAPGDPMEMLLDPRICAHRAAHKCPQERPHFHASAPTTNIQPESPLSANSTKMLAL